MRVRRDPHAERAALLRALGPRPRLVRAGGGESSRPRRDPRTEREAQQVARMPRLRFDRLQRQGAERGALQPETAATKPTMIVIEAPAFLIAVVPDAAGGRLSSHDRQVFGAGRLLAGRDGAVVAICGRSCEGLAAAGADRILDWTEQSAVYDPDADAGAVAALILSLDARAIIFPESTRGGDLLRRVAIATGLPVFCDVDMVSQTAIGRPAQVRRIEQRTAPRGLIGLSSDAVAPYQREPREARPLELARTCQAPQTRAILSAEDIPADPRCIPLALADFVIAAGNGVTDLDTFRSLVDALGGTLGASRVLCDAGLLPRAAQVGASGTVLEAACYLAFGIAGAPQHLQGIAGCEHVIAVNTDLHAAMVERAGLAIIQDAQKVMPALLALLAAEREA